MTTALNPRAQALRCLIEEHLHARLTEKLIKLDSNDPRRTALIERFERLTWLRSAANRVQQIQVATHILKAIYPNAKIKETTNLFVRPDSLPRHPVVGSHLLGDTTPNDVTGNAASLDIYKFLQISHEDQIFLDLCLLGDADLISAFGDEAEEAGQWVRAFADVVNPRCSRPATHALAKQVYWLIGDDPLEDENFHLLAPLFSSQMAHFLYEKIQADRFGDAAGEARAAKKEKKYHPYPVHDYPELASQKIGGSNPQGISQLNSERLGRNFLLASLPPVWVRQDVYLPIRTKGKSIFPIFGRLPEVSRIVKEMARFLQSDPKPNKSTRDYRDHLIELLVDELLVFSTQFKHARAGWTDVPECNLSRSECLWLDPGRGRLDKSFADEWYRMEWMDDIHGNFAAWLNGRLRGKVGRGLPVGDLENRQWQRDLSGDAYWAEQLDLDEEWIDKLIREVTEVIQVEDENVA
jgi:CRISPR-associated protein Csy1